MIALDPVSTDLPTPLNIPSSRNPGLSLLPCLLPFPLPHLMGWPDKSELHMLSELICLFLVAVLMLYVHGLLFPFPSGLKLLQN